MRDRARKGSALFRLGLRPGARPNDLHTPEVSFQFTDKCSSSYAILHLGKDVEHRPMRTHYRGRILIQASLKVEEDEARKLKLDPDDRDEPRVLSETRSATLGGRVTLSLDGGSRQC